MSTVKMVIGHEAEINAIQQDAKAWENSVEAQLKHIIAIAQDQLESLKQTNDVFGVEYEASENRVNKYALEAIVACVNRIKESNK